MAGLTENELKAIYANPAADELNALRARFESIYPNTSAEDFVGGLEQLTTDPKWRTLALKLIIILLDHPAASALTSRNGVGPLSGDIALLYSHLSSGLTDFKNITQLVKAAVTQAEDTELWTIVYNVIARTIPVLQPSTPPPSRPSFPSSFTQTPWSFNTGVFADTSENRTQVDNILKQELKPSLRIDVPDFSDTVFARIPQLDKLAETVFRLCREGNTPLYKETYGWVKWPTSAKEDLVLQWLQDHMSCFMEWSDKNNVHPETRREVYKGPRTCLDGSTTKRKMDVGIAACHNQKDVDGTDDRSVPNWAQILVTGELKSNPIEDGQETVLIDLATYSREVFGSQNRRFVLGFTLCGSIMRLWQFDRSGSSGSYSFNINKEGLKFVKVMLGFYLMDDEQLGFDPTIKKLNGNQYIEITRNSQTERLVLTENIKRQSVIVGRATTCWKAYREGDKSEALFIIKDSWQYEERPEEGELIKDATDKNVQNIARYYHHETVRVSGNTDDIIANVRKGLMKDCGRTSFKQKFFIKSEAPASETSGKAVTGQTQSQSSSLKRSSSTAQMEQQPSKRSYSSHQSIDRGMHTHNRVHRRVITRDIGKNIEKASSLVAVISGMIGAINGHKSLLDVNILHRDISTGNIMLTDQEDDGFLIDFDLAVKMSDNKASGAPSKTGTKVFMAIGALLGDYHSFMHDLESFFWVLFWICIHWNGPAKKREIVKDFENWNYKPIKEFAYIKIGTISEQDNFEKEVKKNFSAYCKPLIPCILELWKVVFPGGKRQLKEDRELYSRMKAVLEKARDNLKAGKAI